MNNQKIIDELNVNEGNEDSDKLYRLTKSERETIIITDDDEKVWTAYTASPSQMKKFEAAGWDCVKITYYSDGTVCTKTFTAPLSRIIIAKERKQKILTEEQKKKLVERAANMRNARNEK